ncbi:MAG: hypothetical protein ACLQMO_06990 [Acidobacteriaceae bacterium]
MKSMFSGLASRIRHRSWPEVTAEVDFCHTIAGGWGVGGGHMVPASYMVGFHYVVDGTSYDGGMGSPVERKKLDTFPIRYNPKNPARNSTDPHPSWLIMYDIALVAIIVSAVLYFALTQP